MSLLAGLARRLHRARERARHFVRTRVQGAEHVGNRAFGRRVRNGDFPAFRKTVERGPDGERALRNELLARELFGQRPWMTPLVERGSRWFSVPAYPDAARLDRLAAELDAATRRAVAAECVSAMLDLLAEGRAHRDFHGKNLFWLDDGLRVVDFETMGQYPEGARPAFPDCYDMTGRGLDSPHLTENQCYVHPGESSLVNLLRVPAAEAVEGLARRLTDELRQASLSFARHDRRHTCRSQRIYASFSLPLLRVDPADAQRDCARRLERFGIERATLAGRSLLDLGSNVGGMLFESQKHAPARSVGVEVDAAKVATARRVAAFNGLEQVRFERLDIERLEPADVGGPFDVVYCLAIVAHLERPERLFELLGRICSGQLYFEGNEGTDVEATRRSLSAAGFREVAHLGSCDDDCRPENNCRPLFRAER